QYSRVMKPAETENKNGKCHGETIIVVNKAGAITPAISVLLVRSRCYASYRATACFSRSACDGRRCLLFCRRERQQNASDDAKKHHIRKITVNPVVPRFHGLNGHHRGMSQA